LNTTRIVDTPPSARLVVATERTPGTPRSVASTWSSAAASGVSTCSEKVRVPDDTASSASIGASSVSGSTGSTSSSSISDGSGSSSPAASAEA
jgi:hypothetical protein